MTSILVVDSSDSNRLFLRLILEKSGYEVLEANTGIDAFQQFEKYCPHLVITEIRLPFLSGVELIQKIKSLSPESFYPVLVVTNEINADEIQKTLTYGADDFLQKPYPEQLLLAKITSLLRNVDFYNDLKTSKELVSSLHKNLALEHYSAEKIFEKFVNGPSNSVPGIETQISPASIFSGDVFLSTITPSGCAVLLLGDFTGHGLPAAIGAIPIAEVFYSMTKKGRSTKEIVSVINSKLKEILPVHMFFGCIVVQICLHRKTVSIFNAGMQPLIQMDSESNAVHQYSSNALPLGVVKTSDLGIQFQTLKIKGTEKFILYSDGVVEAMNRQKKMFGVDNLIKSLQTSQNFDIHQLIEDAQAFCQEESFDDDVSVVKVDTAELFNQVDEMVVISHDEIFPASDWSLNYQLGSTKLHNPYDLFESIVDAVMGMQNLVSFKEDIYIIISELFNNALEHGILKLDSSLKQQENGFLVFAQAKQQALSELKDGEIDIAIHHLRKADFKGQIKIIISHSGEGIRPDNIPSPSSKTFSGRGLTLVHSVCSDLTYSEAGTCATATYDWELSDVT